MRKVLLFATALCLSSAAMAQTTIDSALDAVSGDNSYTLGDDVESASVFWKFTADKDYYATLDKVDESPMPSVAYEKDGSLVTINGTNLTYPKVLYAFKKGVTYYFTVNYARGKVAFNLQLEEAQDLGMGLSQDNPVKIELGKTQYFGDPLRSTSSYEPQTVYATYTAEKDGLFRLATKQSIYSVTINGVKGNMDSDSETYTNYVKTAVKAGETYNFVFSSYNSFLASSDIVNVTEGSIDMPYTLNDAGDNKVPAAQGDYYFTYTPTQEGFLTFSSDAVIPGGQVLVYDNMSSMKYGYDALASSEVGTYNLRMEVKANYGSFKTYYIKVQKLQDSQKEDVFKADMKAYQPGETEGSAIDLSSMPAEAQTLPQATGTYYYKFNVPANTNKFIVVKAKKSDNTTISLYPSGETYNAPTMQNGILKSYVGGNGWDRTYILKVAANEESPLSFTVEYADVAEGSLATAPKKAVLGDNDIDMDGTEYFEYTATQSGKLSVEVDPGMTVQFRRGPQEYDGYYNAIQNANEFYIEATEGTTYLLQVTGATAGSIMTVAEKEFAAGETQNNAIVMTDMSYTLPKSASNLWLVYTATEAGIFDFYCDAPYKDGDYVEIALNNGNFMQMIGNESAGSETNSVYKGKFTVAKGDKVYIHLKLSGDMTGKQVTLSAHQAEQGESYDNPFILTKDQSVAIQGSSRTTPVWVKVSLPAGETKFKLNAYANSAMYTSVENILADKSEYLDWNTIYAPDYSSYSEATVTMAEAGDVYFKFMGQYERSVEFSISEQTATGIKNFEVESDAKVEVYTLDGKKIDQPSGNGVYIIKSNGKAKKVVINK